MGPVMAVARLGVIAMFLTAGLSSTVVRAEEPPSLADDVAAGKLPPLAERLPRVPLVYQPPQRDWSLGRYGGELRTLMAKDRDIRMMVVYGYSRLVGYDEQLRLVPDILQGVDSTDSRAFTLHLRPPWQCPQCF